MASQAFSAQGTIVRISGTEIGEVTGFSGPTTTRGEIDISNLRSTAREYLLALKDFGEFTLNLNLYPGDQGQKICWAALSDNTARTVQLVLADGGTTTLTFPARVRTFEITGQIDAAVTATITLRITGDVTGFPAP